MATDTRVAHWLLDDVVSTVTSYASESSATMASVIAPVAASLLTIYVILWGSAIASGQIQEPFTEGAKRIIRMCLIITFALTTGIYQGTVTRFFLEVPTAIATEISDSAGSDPTTIADVLDEALGKGVEIGNKAWEQGNTKNSLIPPSMAGIGYYALAILIYVSVSLVVAIAAGIIFVAFVALAILLAIGPLFILLAMFAQTKQFFEAWVGQVVSYGILFILAAVSVGMTFALFSEFLNDLPAAEWREVVINTIKIVSATIAVVTVLIETRSIAARLGGGASLSAQNLAGNLLGNTASLTRVAMTGHSGRGTYANASGRISLQTAASSGSKVIKSRYARARRRFQRTNSVLGD